MWNDIECAKKEELKALQISRLTETVERVYTLTPFYKEKFDELKIKPSDIKSLDDIKKLPFTKKQDLRDHYPFGLFTVPMSQVVRVHSSSGTTGKPTVVGYTKRDMDVWDEVMARVFTMAGATQEDIVHNAYGYGLFTGGLGFHSGAEKIGATIIPSSGGFTDRQVMLMKDFGVTILASTPSFALHIAEVASKTGANFKEEFKLKAGIFGAEPTSKGLKEEVAKVWGIDYHEVYGLSEIIGPGVSCSCKNSEHLHIFEDHFYPEIIDPKTGEQLPDGKRGELVITSLTKQALPIIRYRTGDITSLIRTPCKCGRTMVRMESVVGRVDDMIIINGVNVYPSQVEHVISQTEGLSLNYQIVVDKKGHLDQLDILIEVSDEIMIDSVGEMEKIKKDIQHNLLTNLYIKTNVKLVEPRSIERSVGKAVRIIDKRK
ncbi:phenylacetate--CoA ligase [Halarcobacter ebronensis]|uniref:Phenylacetate-coenzyme A ligase n=1 Tax=Halarcobacter ebronensis TaxID=1462615 RepID=A0A4Q0YI35_9BACT|nr:phenylacetate--CoA ligase [Halarcobacter ebronensis]RXK04386.1 phenylacetate--CoA ligase [Halarcobacter ebronensis]